MEKGILGIKKDPKNQMLFSFVVRNGDEWPSSDSNDSDYCPESNGDEQAAQIVEDKPSKSRKKRSIKCYGDGDASRLKKRRKRASASSTAAERSVDKDDSQCSLDEANSSAAGVVVSEDSSATIGTESIDARNINEFEEDKCISQPVGCTSTIQLSTSANQFPCVVLRKIFAYVVEDVGAYPFLERAARVCKHWAEVAKDSSLWKKIDLSYGWIKSKEDAVKKICQHQCSYLSEINLSGCKTLSQSGLQLLAENCRNLRTVNLSQCRFNSAGLLHLAEKCPLLSDITLSAYSNTDGLSAKSLMQLVTKCATNLRSVNLSDNSLKGFNNVLKLMSANCPQLEFIDLSNVNVSSDFITLDIEDLQQGWPLLKVLRLTNSPFRVSNATIQKKVLSPGFPCLQELSVGTTQGALDRNADLLHRILKRSHNLKLLDLRGWSKLNGDCLQSLPVLELERLYISGSSVAKYEGIEIIITKWHHSLIELDLSWNVYPADSLDMAMIKLSSDPSRSKLEVLDLRGTQISANRVKTILEGCPNLRLLSLESCRGLPRGMKKEYSVESLAQLRRDIDSLIALDNAN